eukprot:gene49445-16313_t
MEQFGFTYLTCRNVRVDPFSRKRRSVEWSQLPIIVVYNGIFVISVSALVWDVHCDQRKLPAQPPRRCEQARQVRY